MNPYSHIILANNLANQWHPADLTEYYLGAVIPDVRYLCGWRRQQTHLPSEQIVHYVERYPHLRPFVAGYSVHCALDEISLVGNWLRFPLTWLIWYKPKHLLPVLVECYLLTHRVEHIRVSQESNEMLDDLGVDRHQVARFGSEMDKFLAAPSLDAWIALARGMGIAASP